MTTSNVHHPNVGLNKLGDDPHILIFGLLQKKTNLDDPHLKLTTYIYIYCQKFVNLFLGRFFIFKLKYTKIHYFTSNFSK